MFLIISLILATLFLLVVTPVKPEVRTEVAFLRIFTLAGGIMLTVKLFQMIVKRYKKK